MHNLNGIIGARSASQLAPDSVASTGNECIRSSVVLLSLQSQVHNAVQYFGIGPHFVPKRCLLKTAFPMNLPSRGSLGHTIGTGSNFSFRILQIWAPLIITILQNVTQFILKFDRPYFRLKHKYSVISVKLN